MAIGKRKSTQNLLKELSNNKLQSVPIIDNSVIPEPFDLKYDLSAAQAHRRRRRMSSNRRCRSNDRYLLFMLDTSGSIGNDAFTRMTANLSELVFYFCGNTKIAAMTFGSHIYHEFCFNCEDINKVERIQEAIQNIPYHGGLTYTGEALKCACDNILTKSCGLPKRNKYKKCPAPIDVVMITSIQPLVALNGPGHFFPLLIHRPGSRPPLVTLVKFVSSVAETQPAQKLPQRAGNCNDKIPYGY